MNRMRHLLVCGLLGAASLWALPAFASEEIATRAGCTVCHAGAVKPLGPLYKDIAAKYRGDAAAPKALAARVRTGGSGVWGPIPMIATPPERISDAELAATIAWILAQ
jgi:cytochrome c